ncbi:hypothetical protein SKAU_G00319480 [Synaphobranchus kaupii]|uniref:Uncharacterized protein n=1 Tax=Synaphobranchus kaupii TaxID=118154 RepID=A0A9Q1END5_SYNKA|nr:hypothetical protein SKAU_G00319480 [Synaphobranchus kaupii]
MHFTAGDGRVPGGGALLCLSEGDWSAVLLGLWSAGIPGFSVSFPPERKHGTFRSPHPDSAALLESRGFGLSLWDGLKMEATCLSACVRAYVALI